MPAYDEMLRKATIKAIDSVARKFAGPTVTKQNAVTKVFDHWNAMTPLEKERVSGVIVATTITAITALAALRGKKKKRGRK